MMPLDNLHVDARWQIFERFAGDFRELFKRTGIALVLLPVELGHRGHDVVHANAGLLVGKRA